jgi:hypothetical protein
MVGVFRGFNVRQEESVVAACCSMLAAFLETQGLGEITKTQQNCSLYSIQRVGTYI